MALSSIQHLLHVFDDVDTIIPGDNQVITEGSVVPITAS